MTPPSPPTDAQATAVKDQSAALVTWISPLGTVTRYEVLTLPTRTLQTRDAGEPNLTVTGLRGGTTYSFQVVAVNADGRSAPADTGAVTTEAGKASSWWRVTSWLFVAATLAGLLFFLSRQVQHKGEVVPRSLCLAFAVFLVVSLALTWINVGDFGMWRPIIGLDRRVSTSQLATYLWTGLIGFALLYFVGRAWFDGRPHLFDGVLPGENNPTSVWPDYLILLGGPFVALVAARGIVTAKVATGVVQKTIADDGSASLKQALTGDDDNVDLVDTQYFLFNLVALTYVVIGLIKRDQLPAIPPLLLALTSTSAAAYVLNKSIQQNAPVVTSLTPSAARPGDRIVVTGSNFAPAGSIAPPTVTIGGAQAVVEAPCTDTQLSLLVPPGLPATQQMVVITTAARISSAQVSLTVLADKPVITGVRPPFEARVDTEITLQGSGFVTEADPVKVVSVVIDSSPAQTCRVTVLANGLDEVRVRVPPSIATNTDVPVQVRTLRQTDSNPIQLRFLP